MAALEHWSGLLIVKRQSGTLVQQWYRLKIWNWLLTGLFKGCLLLRMVSWWVHCGFVSQAGSGFLLGRTEWRLVRFYPDLWELSCVRSHGPGYGVRVAIKCALQCHYLGHAVVTMVASCTMSQLELASYYWFQSRSKDLWNFWNDGKVNWF